MNADEFAKFALQLQEQDELTEAGYRTVVGRWYYSAFHIANEWLQGRFTDVLENVDGSTHIRLTNCCSELQRQYKDLKLSKLG